MESFDDHIETKYDFQQIISRIQIESLSKLIIQVPNDLLPEGFRFKRSLQKQIPSLSINILCDKHVFIIYSTSHHSLIFFKFGQ